MPVFEYTALNKLGRRERGAVQADSPDEARRKLRAEHVHVLHIDVAEVDADERPELARRTIRLRRIRSRDLAAATRQLATLLHAGMSLVPALGALVEQLSGRPLAGVVANIRDKVNQGGTFAAALEEHPQVFSALFVNMVRAGEAAGALEDVLLRLAEMLEKRANLMNKVKAALAYPLFMAVVGIAVVVFLLHFVIPSIAKLFVEMNQVLPWPTVLLIWVSKFFEKYLWALIISGGATVFAARLWVRTPAGRLAWDRLKLKTPLFGELALRIAVARFARTLGVLLASGVSILDSLEIVKRVVGNAVLANALDEAKDSVSHGDSIANPLRRSGVFPPVVFHMIAVGEASGNIEEGLLNVADAYDNEVQSSVEALTSLLEPVMILVMGAVVGFIVLAMLLPIFDINQAIH